MGISFYVYRRCPGVLDFACKGLAVRHFVCRDNDDDSSMFAISYILFLFIILYIYMQIHVNKLHPDMVRTCAYMANCQTPKDHRCGTRLYLAARWMTFRAPCFPCKNKTGMKKKLTVPLKHFFSSQLSIMCKGKVLGVKWDGKDPFSLSNPVNYLSLPTVRQLDVGQGDLTRHQRYPF